MNENTTWPDIGQDPLKANGEIRKQLHDSTMDRLMKGFAVQQKEVPDQMQLCWRIDVQRLHDEVTWRRAAMKNRNSLPSAGEIPNGAMEKQALSA